MDEINAEEKQLTENKIFTAPVYTIEKLEFLKVAKKISKKFISKRKKQVELNPIYPVYMTESINHDPEMLDFSNFVAQTGWNILAHQGYDMNKFRTYFESMWCQEHHPMSSMEKHIHGNNVFITGFYFLSCPKDSCKIIFHDPRDAKVITGLPEANPTQATIASNMINFEPKPGLLVFSNAWLPHSFTKNASKNPMQFIHFNIAVSFVPEQPVCSTNSAEVI